MVIDKVSFRYATENDIPEIATLAALIWKEYYPSIISEAQIDYMLQKMYSHNSLLQQINSNHEFTVALHDNKIVAFISISPEEFPGEYFLNKFYILKNFRSKGIGKRLFDTAIQRLPSNPKVVRLVVNRKNTEAIVFYKKIGFDIEGIKDIEIGEGYQMNDYIMAKQF